MVNLELYVNIISWSATANYASFLISRKNEHSELRCRRMLSVLRCNIFKIEPPEFACTLNYSVGA